MKKMILGGGLVAMFSALSCVATAQKPIFRIEVNVTAEDSIKGELISTINQNLRSLGDVVLTDAEPQIRISVMAIKNAIPGYLNSYALSIVVSSPIPTPFKTLLLSGYSGREKEARLSLLKNQESITNHFMRIGSDLSRICKQIVADIDSEDIENERKTYKHALDVLKSAEPKPN
jgi:hypothetical protein